MDPSTRNELGVRVIAKFFENIEKLGAPLPQLWTDAFEFMTQGARAKGKDEVIEQGFLRVSVLLAAAAFEGFVNYVAERVVQAGDVHGIKLTEFELDCLGERRRILDNGVIKVKRQIYSTRERFLLLCRKLSHGHAISAEYEAKLESSIETRDLLVHPKPGNPINVDAKCVMGFFTAALWLSESLAGLSFSVTNAENLGQRDRNSDFTHGVGMASADGQP